MHSWLGRMEVHFRICVLVLRVRSSEFILWLLPSADNAKIVSRQKPTENCRLYSSRRFSRITYSNQLTCTNFVATTQNEKPEGNKFQCRTATWHSQQQQKKPLRRTVLTCLSISKYACIVSLKCICQYVSSDRIENLLLGGKMHRIRVRWVKTMVKCECFRLFPVVAKEQKRTENYIKWNFLFTELLRETVYN